MPAEYTDHIETTIEYIDNERINKGLKPVDRYEILAVYETPQALQDDLVAKTRREILELYLFVEDQIGLQKFVTVLEAILAR